MAKISKAALKKAILAVEAERAASPVAFRPDRAQRAALQKSRRASSGAVSRFLAEAGLDMKQFQAAQERRSAELERMIAKQKADALRRARQKPTLHSNIVGQTRALQALSSRPDFFPHPSFTLDTPFLIWTTPLQSIADSAAVPFGSWARFKFKTSQYQGTQKLGFYFYWVNSYSDYVVINAATFMSATGHLKSHAPWTVGVNTSWIEATAKFGLWFGWPNNVDSTDYATEFLGHTGAYGDTWTGGDTNGASISAGVSLNKTMFAAPPGQAVVFEVALAVEYENDEGDIEADFESGNFNITCPLVVFSLLNVPPGVIS
jgi:hypothetical protein